MKNKIYLFGILLILLFTLGAVFKIMHWPGAGVLLTCSLLTFSLVFTPLAIYSAYRLEQKHAYVYVAGMVTVMFSFLGAQFKLMHWPGAGIMLIIAFLAPFLIFLPAYLIYRVKSEEKEQRNLIFVLFLLAYLGAMNALLALNVSKSVLNDFELVNEQHALLADYYKQSANNNLRLADSSKLEKVLIVSKQTESIVNHIVDLKKDMLVAASRENEESLKHAKNINAIRIDGKDNRSAASIIMIHQGGALELKTSLNNYKNLMLDLADSKDDEIINKYLNTADVEWEGEYLSWEDAHFQGAILIWALNYLTSLEFNVRLVESEIIESMIGM